MELFIVGSLRVEWKEFEDYLGYLMSLSQEKDNIHVISKYLSDEEFDCWINACDVIVIPYREIWSSSVLARGKLYNKPIIAADIGGLRNQLEDCDILFQNDDDLMIIFEEFSSLIK
jgi:glycosyltransferase involved in cell wall biosynthesis